MEFVFEFVKNIVAVTIILNIVDCLVASSEYSKYIKLFTGMLIVVGILSFVINGAGSSRFGSLVAKEKSIDAKVTTGCKVYKKNMDKRLEKVHRSIVKDYKNSIEKDLRLIGMEMKSLRIKEDRRLGGVERIFIRVKVSEGRRKVYKKEVYNVINKYYSLDYDALKVEIIV